MCSVNQKTYKSVRLMAATCWSISKSEAELKAVGEATGTRTTAKSSVRMRQTIRRTTHLPFVVTAAISQARDLTDSHVKKRDFSKKKKQHIRRTLCHVLWFHPDITLLSCHSAFFLHSAFWLLDATKSRVSAESRVKVCKDRARLQSQTFKLSTAAWLQAPKTPIYVLILLR